jgi:hypothetical protein
VAGDDESLLRLSTDENPANVRDLGWVPDWTDYPRQWDKYASQQSGFITLEAGKRYYVEAFMKDGVGGDHLAVGWQLPDGTLERPIPGNHLEPFSSRRLTWW